MSCTCTLAKTFLLLADSDPSHDHVRIYTTLSLPPSTLPAYLRASPQKGDPPLIGRSGWAPRVWGFHATHIGTSKGEESTPFSTVVATYSTREKVRMPQKGSIVGTCPLLPPPLPCSANLAFPPLLFFWGGDGGGPSANHLFLKCGAISLA